MHFSFGDGLFVKFMKLKFRRKLTDRGQEQNRGFNKKPFLFVGKFLAKTKLVLHNLKKSYVLMTKPERRVALVLLLIGFALLGYKGYQSYLNKTVLIPDYGGQYSEIVVGEAKFLNPVVAQTDTEKSVSRLIFHGLVKIYDAKTVETDIADSYNVSTDGKTYTFNLRQDVFFSDGQQLTANDVAYTVSTIKNPDNKSPLYNTWADVEVNVVDGYTIEFVLPSAYGPFIYNCDFGIIPSYLSVDDFSKKIVGAGPYQYNKSTKNTDGKFTEIDLTANNNYYNSVPYISEIKISLVGSDSDAVSKFQNDSTINGIFAADQSQGQILDYKSSRQLGLVLNLRKDSLKDSGTRQKLLTGQNFDTPIKLSLSTLNSPNQQRKAEELRQQFAAQNVDLIVNYYSSSAVRDKIANRDYELLLYGFDFGYDRDPYTYWHSSQVNNLNLAGFSDKSTDILMEDARMIDEVDERNAKYDEIYQKFTSQYAVVFYPQISYDFAVKPIIKGIGSVSGSQPASRFENIENWYIKEKRISQ